jgi:hypothetical protein
MHLDPQLFGAQRVAEGTKLETRNSKLETRKQKPEQNQKKGLTGQDQLALALPAP